MPEQLDFTGQVAVITGAGGGVGRAYALDLARRGAKIVVNDLGGATDGTGGSDAMANRVCEEIRALDAEAVPNTDSVATPEGGAAIVQTALDRFGRIDILISNAGILRDKTFAKLEWTNLDAVLDVHLRAAFYVGQPAFRAMKEAGNGGKIMLTTSASGLFGNFGQSNYTAAKLGLVGLMRTLSLEGARNNIQVNAVAPVASTRLTGGETDSGPRAPSRVSPLVTALCHPSCTITGETFMAGDNWYTRVFVGQAEGWAADENLAVTAEDIADHWDTIRDPSKFTEPPHAMVSMATLERLRDAESPSN